MSAREYLWAVQESALGTVMASPVAGVNSNWVRLSDGFFNMLAQPVYEDVAYGGGVSTNAFTVSDHYEVKGQLKMKLYPGQAHFWLNWATANSSMSLYHGVRRSDGTYKRTRFGGTKPSAWTIEVSRRQLVAVLTLDLIACESFGNAMDGTADPDATEFPFPVDDSGYPASPYTFANTSGHLTVGTLRSSYDSLRLSCQNDLDPKWFETAHLQDLVFTGRKTQLDAALYLKSTPDDLAALEGLTPQTATLGFVQGSNSLTIALNGANVITGAANDLGLNTAYMRNLTLKNFWDSVAGSDLSIS